MATLEDIDAFFDALVDGGEEQSSADAAASPESKSKTEGDAADSVESALEATVRESSKDPDGNFVAQEAPNRRETPVLTNDLSFCAEEGTAGVHPSSPLGLHTAGSEDAARLNAAQTDEQLVCPPVPTSLSAPASSGGSTASVGVYVHGVNTVRHPETGVQPVVSLVPTLAGSASRGEGDASLGAPSLPAKRATDKEQPRSPTSGRGGTTALVPAPPVCPASAAEPGKPSEAPSHHTPTGPFLSSAPSLSSSSLASSSHLTSSPSLPSPAHLPALCSSTHPSSLSSSPQSSSLSSAVHPQGVPGVSAVAAPSFRSSQPQAPGPQHPASVSASLELPSVPHSATPSPPFPLHDRAFPGISGAPQFLLQNSTACAKDIPRMSASPPEYFVDPPLHSASGDSVQEEMAFCAETVSRLIEAKLLENDQMLFAVHENLASGRYDEAVCFFERLQQNLFFLAMLADQQPAPSRQAAFAKDTAEEVSQVEQRFRSNTDFWSHEELQRLHHALRTPNLDLRQLSAAVCTKTPQQIFVYLTKVVDRHVKAPPHPPKPAPKKENEEASPPPRSGPVHTPGAALETTGAPPQSGRPPASGLAPLQACAAVPSTATPPTAALNSSAAPSGSCPVPRMPPASAVRPPGGPGQLSSETPPEQPCPVAFLPGFADHSKASSSRVDPAFQAPQAFSHGPPSGVRTPGEGGDALSALKPLAAQKTADTQFSASAAYPSSAALAPPVPPHSSGALLSLENASLLSALPLSHASLPPASLPGVLGGVPQPSPQTAQGHASPLGVLTEQPAQAGGLSQRLGQTHGNFIPFTHASFSGAAVSGPYQSR
ncbi:SSXT (amine-terminal region) protein [Toxoplasma gondii TgCatPRC2]|uniref:SSXT (Amine-terminal region) protein n=1 Tax=Toxoplasma gondii TgCatPRC2 TaxID=1130821 RepID=A0A151HJ07_TOXGO|nr:SSXT (amine-terminal region) protein [Toxoplasma gondii TgCatPRC2]